MSPIAMLVVDEIGQSETHLEQLIRLTRWMKGKSVVDVESWL